MKDLIQKIKCSLGHHDMVQYRTLNEIDGDLEEDTKWEACKHCGRCEVSVIASYYGEYYGSSRIMEDRAETERMRQRFVNGYGIPQPTHRTIRKGNPT